eukprot:1272476-Amphidinium_carterae.1
MGTVVGCHISHAIPLQIWVMCTPFLSIFIRLMAYHPHDLHPSRKRIQGPTFEVLVPSLGLPSSCSQRMKASNHTLANTDQPSRLAFFKRSDRRQKFRSIDRLLPRQPDTFPSARVVTNPTPAKVRVATVPTRTISPHGVNTWPGNQTRFM